MWVDNLDESLQQLIVDTYKSVLLLPALQRKYTWKPQQIVELFDSLMQGYPINTIMLWEVEQLSDINLDFYKFLDPSYHDGIDNTLLTKEEKKIKGKHQIVIDGQQRITSLYIAFYGTYNGGKLCLRLDHKASKDDEGLMYDFRFLSEQEKSRLERKGQRWMKVSEVLDDNFKRHKCERAHDTLDQPFEDFASDAIERLENVFKRTKLTGFVIKDCEDLDSVLDIFVRTNSGGKPLTKGDLLSSSLTTSWASHKNANAREFIDEQVIGRVEKETGFEITNDWVFKSFVFLNDSPLTMTVRSFQKAAVSSFVYDHQQEISDSVVKAFSIVQDFGLLEKGLTTKLAIIPIVYYIFKNKLQKETFSDTQHKESYEAMRKFVFCSILNNLFAKKTDNTLREVRGVFASVKGKVFPCQAIFDKIEGLALTEDRLNSLLKTKKSDAFPLLNIMYALENRPLNPTISYDVDHTHPKAKCEEARLEEAEYDSVLNLNLMSSSKNRSKSDKEVQKWLDLKNEDERQRWKEYNLIPLDAPMDLSDFSDFLQRRKELFRNVLVKLM